jgi:putative DNA primase/helicase
MIDPEISHLSQIWAPARQTSRHTIATCPFCRKLKLYVSRGKTGRLLLFCQVCGPDQTLNLFRELRLATQGSSFPIAIPDPEEDEEERERRRQAHEDILNLWQNSEPLDGTTLGDRYLWEHRGFGELRDKLLADVQFTSTVHFHPRVEYLKSRGWYMPALVISMVNAENQLVSLRRIYLAADGSKAKVNNPKKMMPLGRDTTGSAHRLQLASDKLAVCEGVETAIALTHLTGFPVWAAGDAFKLETMFIPPAVKQVLICADNDKSERGKQAASGLAQRIVGKHESVKVILPEYGKDFDDWYQLIRS